DGGRVGQQAVAGDVGQEVDAAEFAVDPFKQLQGGLLSALPHLASVVAMVLTSWLSDRWRSRSLLVAAALLAAGVGWAVAWQAENPWAALAGLCLAQAGMMAVLPVFWALPPLFLGGAAAAAGIALINSVANIGGIFAPRIIGAWGVGPMVAFMVWGVLMALLARTLVENRRDRTGDKDKTHA
ncbi:MAG: MFS transporter, partial [Gemmataceae bacterium]